jgi:hypothetical protein
MFTAELPLDLSLQQGRPMVQVDVYEQGGLKQTGLWISDRDGKWQRCPDPQREA